MTPTDALREAARVREAAQYLKAWLDDFEKGVEEDGHGPLGDCWSVGFPDVPEGLELGWLRRFASLAAPAPTGPWKAYEADGWWVRNGNHIKRGHGPFTESQAHGVADKLNELEPKT